MAVGSTSDNGNLIRFTSLVTLVFANVVQVLVTNYALTRNRPEKLLSSCAVFWMEVMKLCISILLTVVQERSPIRCIEQMYEYIIKSPVDTLKVCVPSIIYTIQNNLSFEALAHLDAATFMVAYQLKILTTALCSVWILRKPLSWFQWLSLVVLFVGVSTVQLGEKAQKGKVAVDGKTVDELASEHHQSRAYGLMCVVVACWLSGFAGVYFEKILKNDMHGSQLTIWMRNIQLAVLAVPISLATVYTKDGDIVSKHGLTYGFDNLVWICVFINAIYGLTVAVVLKYASNILKGFATSISIIFSCVASMYLFAFSPSLIFTCGAFLVIASVVIYSKFPYQHPLPAPSSELEAIMENGSAETEALPKVP